MHWFLASKIRRSNEFWVFCVALWAKCLCVRTLGTSRSHTGKSFTCYDQISSQWMPFTPVSLRNPVSKSTSLLALSLQWSFSKTPVFEVYRWEYRRYTYCTGKYVGRNVPTFEKLENTDFNKGWWTYVDIYNSLGFGLLKIHLAFDLRANFIESFMFYMHFRVIFFY